MYFISPVTPTPTSPKLSSPPLSPQLAPQGPSQLLTGLLARLPDATNRTLIDQAAVDFAFLNSKAARKRLIKVTTPILSTALPNRGIVFGKWPKESHRSFATLFQTCRYAE